MDDADAVFLRLGRFVVAFQVLENQLWQLGSLALDPGHVGHGRRALADLTFFKLCKAVEAAVLAALDAQSREATEFRGKLRDIMDRCDELRIARNLLIHSTYVFVEAGGELVGIMRSDVSAAADNHEVEFDQEWLDADSFADAIERAALRLSAASCTSTGRPRAETSPSGPGWRSPTPSDCGRTSRASSVRPRWASAGPGP